MKNIAFVTLIIIFLFFTNNTYSQNDINLSDTVYKRNVIKWNMTPFILFSYKNINLSYERILSSHRSFSINAGYFELPFTGLFDSLFVSKSTEKSGFNIAGDYRYYFKERNKNWAPDGLYWGIYSSYHHFKFNNTINIINQPDIQGDVSFGGSINIISVGAELGYQFIIKEKLAIDLVFIGPSLSAYNRKFTLGGNLDNENEYLEAIIEALKDRYPYFNELTEAGVIENTKAQTHMGYGMRYLIQIGYRF